MSFISWILAFLLFLSIPPVYSWSFPFFGTVFVVLYLLLMAILGRTTFSSIIYIVLLSFLYLYFGLRNDVSVGGVLYYFSMCFLFLSSQDLSSDVFGKFCKITAFLLIPGIVYYLLVLFGIASFLPTETVMALNDSKEYRYVYYVPFLLMPEHFDANFFRFTFVFDEPGVVGTLCGVLLLVKGIHFKSWETYSVLIAGILSFSLAFFAMLFMAMLLDGKVKEIIWIIILFLIVIISLRVFDIDFISTYLLERLKPDSGVGFSGNNRVSESFNRVFKEFSGTSDFFFGMGHWMSKTKNFGGASYKDLIYDNGIVFFVLYAMAFLSYAFHQLKNNKLFLVYFGIFFGVMYQRPFIHSVIYFVLLLFPIAYLSQLNKSSK